MTQQVEISPQPGLQEAMLSSSADIVIAGGSAGSGKSFSLLLECLRHHSVRDFRAVIFRRTYPRLTGSKGLWDVSQDLYRAIGGRPREGLLEWRFPSGAELKMGHMQHESDRYDWQGKQITLICWDELQEFDESQFWFLFSRNRSTCGVRPYIRATCNPVPEDDPIGGWLHKLLAWWIGEDGMPDLARAGRVRWFIRVEDLLVWADSREALISDYPGSEPKSLTFIPGRLDDNQALLRADPGYRANLLALPRYERERLLGGNWKVRAEAGKVFDRSWFRIVEAAPADAVRIRAWDKAGTEAGGKYSAGVRMSRTAQGLYYVEHVERGQWSSFRRNQVMRQIAESDGVTVQIELEQEPGSGGKESAELSIRELAGWTVHAAPASGDKVTRANPFAAQAEAGNVLVVRGEWNEAYLSELHHFPDGAYLDQVDGSSLAFNQLALASRLPGDYGITLNGGSAHHEQDQHYRGMVELHNGVPIDRHAVTGCPRCQARLAGVN